MVSYNNLIDRLAFDVDNKSITLENAKDINSYVYDNLMYEKSVYTGDYIKILKDHKNKYNESYKKIKEYEKKKEYTKAIILCDTCAMELNKIKKEFNNIPDTLPDRAISTLIAYLGTFAFFCGKDKIKTVVNNKTYHMITDGKKMQNTPSEDFANHIVNNNDNVYRYYYKTNYKHDAVDAAKSVGVVKGTELAMNGKSMNWLKETCSMVMSLEKYNLFKYKNKLVAKKKKYDYDKKHSKK